LEVIDRAVCVDFAFAHTDQELMPMQLFSRASDGGPCEGLGTWLRSQTSTSVIALKYGVRLLKTVPNRLAASVLLVEHPAVPSRRSNQVARNTARSSGIREPAESKQRNCGGAGAAIRVVLVACRE
jgi:hypothetical protein